MPSSFAFLIWSVWLRDTILQAAKTYLPPEDVVVDGKFAMRIIADHMDEAEENFWSELAKNIDLFSGTWTINRKANL